MTDVPAELKELSATLSSIESVVDVPTLRAEVAELDRTDVDSVRVGGGRQDAHALLDDCVEQRQRFEMTERRGRAATQCS